jgi:hypothetical protein
LPALTTLMALACDGYDACNCDCNTAGYEMDGMTTSLPM